VAITSYKLAILEFDRPDQDSSTVRPDLPGRIASVDLDEASGATAWSVAAPVSTTPARPAEPVTPGSPTSASAPGERCFPPRYGFRAGFAWRV
jgi:hypothetical protein